MNNKIKNLQGVNFRKLFLVPKDYNAKGIALLLSGYCNLYNILYNIITFYFDTLL